MKTTLQTLALGLALAAFALPSAQAGTTTAVAHTFVSSTGLDSNGKMTNPCSRSAPCATFQTALSVTNPGGIVSVIDSGDYGPMTIGQNVTVDGTGSNAAITLAADGAAVTITPGSNATVTLRHLTLTGPGENVGNTYGIRVSDGRLLVDGCKLSDFGSGILSLGGSMVVQNTAITICGTGVSDNSGTGLLSLRDDTVQGCIYGVSQYNGGQMDLSRCTLAQHSGLALGGASGAIVGGTNGETETLTATGCTISGNKEGVAAGPGLTINLNDNDVWNNGTGFSLQGGVIATAGNNRKAGNATPGAPTPGATVLVQ